MEIKEINGKLNGLLVDAICDRTSKEFTVFVSSRWFYSDDVIERYNLNINEVIVREWYQQDLIEFQIYIVCPICGHRHNIMVPLETRCLGRRE